jgi:hypothetical protein
VPLPETAAWPGLKRPVDVTIETGPIPKLESDLPGLAYLKSVGGGKFVFDRLPHAHFLVDRGSIVIDENLSFETADWRASLLGPVLGLMCYLRDLLPLHASALRVGKRVVAFAGRSGAGKSTIAAGLLQRGHQLVADDVCALESLASNPLVLPSYPGLKLSSTSLAMLGIDPFGLAMIDDDKFQLVRADRFDPTALALDTIYLIENAPEDMEDAVLELNGAAAFERLSAEIYRPEIGRFALTNSAFFAAVVRLTQCVEIRLLRRRLAEERICSLIDLIEADVAKR